MRHSQVGTVRRSANDTVPVPYRWSNVGDAIAEWVRDDGIGLTTLASSTSASVRRMRTCMLLPSACISAVTLCFTSRCRTVARTLPSTSASTCGRASSASLTMPGSEMKPSSNEHGDHALAEGLHWQSRLRQSRSCSSTLNAERRCARALWCRTEFLTAIPAIARAPPPATVPSVTRPRLPACLPRCC